MSTAEATPWLAGAGGATPFEDVLAHRPALLERFRAFYASLWNDARVPARVLELCRQRVAAIHDCAAEAVLRDARVALSDAELATLRSGRFAAFLPAERAALAVAEAMPFGHHGIADADVNALREHFGNEGAVALLTAIAFFDVVARWKIVFAVPAEAHALAQPPLVAGALA